MSIEEIHEDKWPSFLPKPYSGNDKHQQLKDFVQAVTATVLEDVSNELIKSDHINDTKIEVVQKIINTQNQLTEAKRDNLKLGREIDSLNAAHKSEIEAMKLSFSQAALQTWMYPKNDSGHSPAPIRPEPTPSGSSPSKETGKSECCVCLGKPAIMACVPCGHRCLCEDCATEAIQTCPICRQSRTGYMRIFEKKMPAPANPFFI